jgi:hypothetical protein
MKKEKGRNASRPDARVKPYLMLTARESGSVSKVDVMPKAA